MNSCLFAFSRFAKRIGCRPVGFTGGTKGEVDNDNDNGNDNERGGRAVSLLSSASERRGIDPRLRCLTLDVLFLVSVFVSQLALTS